ncbi:MAG TPA: hypothetical protein EYO33_08800 [Phycisphaerales bacterium]|nr:hypothetical protein [Phycisphaerales bacterium]
MKNRGLTLAEIVVAILILVTVMLSYFTLTQSTIRSTGLTRNQVLATQAAENVIEELIAHPYGAPFPEENLNYEPQLFVQGRTVETRFKITVEPDRSRGGNGSFRGDTNDDFDIVKVEVSWNEPEPSGRGTRSRSLDFSLTLRRQYDL